MATPITPAATIGQAKPVAEQARGIAHILLEGFNKHYALFRECARAARRHFEAGNWLAIQHVARDRIDFYDRRVQETADRIARLQALSVRGTRWPRLVVTDAPVSTRSTSIGTAAMRPRFRWLTGVWY